MSADKQTRNSKPRKANSDLQRLSRRFMSGLLRSLFLINRTTRPSSAGFVLPTTVLLLLVTTLTVGALTFRTASRTQDAFQAREQQVIDNVAAPAVDRAKAKLEYLFTRDNRLPGTGTPPSDVLYTLMSNIDSVGAGGLGITALGTDPYTLPDEERIDINGDGTVDNAWSFSFDLNADGTQDAGEFIAYSVLMDDAVDTAGTLDDRTDDIKIEDTGPAANALKANNLVTRNGPVNTDETLAACGGAREPEQGWFPINAANLEKNFQITAYASNSREEGRANSAMELQQVRRALRGNRWGAWFKYDMEIHPGPDFNWNGAIHTDGNMLVTNNFQGHMISSHNSCLYTLESSTITMAEADNDNDGVIDVDSGDFQGQLIAGAPSYADLNARGTPRFHIFTDIASAPTINNADTRLTTGNDSVEGSAFNDMLEVMLDPVALFTRNISQHRDTTWDRDDDWDDNAYNTGGRVVNQNLAAPYLDDFYRADNRYGPRPQYDTTNWVTDTEDGANNADDKQLGDEILAADPNADNLINELAGLDGYWERQAMSQGMRVVVGQRLELGNTYGWNYDAATNSVVANSDPLYPTDPNGMANKQKQRVTLRDNLAAVQGMVVYHYESGNDGNYPLACIANTAHPGTIETLQASRTFNTYESGEARVDFLTGEGTNGWEFDFPAAFDTEAEFGAQLANNNPLGIALRNLAYFAGDPNGGSPSFTPLQDNTIHPFPHQAMWGDYSVLRRIFDDRLDSAAWNPALATSLARYNALSPADRSSLHSAACTLGMLAYNLDSVINETSGAIADGGGLQDVGTHLSQLIDGVSNGGNPELEDLVPGAIAKDDWVDPDEATVVDGCPAGTDGPDFQPECDTGEYYQQFTSEDWITAYTIDQSPSAAELQAIRESVSQIQASNQIRRDRLYGFGEGSAPPLDTGGSDSVAWDPVTGLTEQKQIGGENVVVKTSCDPDIFYDVTASGGSGGSNARARIGLSLMVCSVDTESPIKYPSLYYLFPTANHDQGGGGTQPATEDYINQNYITNVVNNGVTYGVVGDDGFIPTVEDATDTGLAAIAFAPREMDGSDWELPTGTPTLGDLNPESMDIKVINGANDVNVGLSLLEKVMYNGREEMAVRVLDVDLGALTQDQNVADYWISDDQDATSGIFYAAREDAAREDSVVRPASAGTAWEDCDTLGELLGTAACWMLPSTAAGPTDPPLSERDDGSAVGISLKPIDFAPDPDRRPNGFRLNAALNGNNGDLSASANVGAERTWGLTFVTDNSVYVKGTFNPHTTNGTDTIEEFEETLFDGDVTFGNQFYNDRVTSNTDEFATDADDRWRVAEILADAVSPLSTAFVDGAIQEGFIRDRDQTSNDFQNVAGANSRTSFHNQQRPLREDNTTWADASGWLRVDGSYTNDTVPIWVGKNGESRTTTDLFDDATSDTNFILENERSGAALIDAATPERMNATIIGGLVPSRARQGYGGLHNFPRFLEDWGGQDLFIQGAFLQLNFSTASTGPFDLDAWEPGDATDNAEHIGYYSPPSRRWGYDVGLQYTPAGPIAQRFVTVDRPRSEHYRELPLEDPYVTNLRCSLVLDAGGDWQRRFPQEDCP